MTTLEAISYGLLILLITTWVSWVMGKHHDRQPGPRPPAEPATPARGHEHPPA